MGGDPKALSGEMKLKPREALSSCVYDVLKEQGHSSGGVYTHAHGVTVVVEDVTIMASGGVLTYNSSIPGPDPNVYGNPEAAARVATPDVTRGIMNCSRTYGPRP